MRNLPLLTKITQLVCLLIIKLLEISCQKWCHCSCPSMLYQRVEVQGDVSEERPLMKYAPFWHPLSQLLQYLFGSLSGQGSSIPHIQASVKTCCTIFLECAKELLEQARLCTCCGSHHLPAQRRLSSFLTTFTSRD